MPFSWDKWDLGPSFPFGASLRLAHDMQASNFNDFENHCELYITGIVENDYEARPDVVSIWTAMAVKSFPDRGRYGNKRCGKKMGNLVSDAIYLT